MKQRNSEKIELLSAEQHPTAGERTDESAQDGASKPPDYRRLGRPIVVFMIIGKVVGGGLVWFPKALSEAGWIGFVVMGISFATSMLTGVLLARSWLVLMKWYPAKYRDVANRHPYPSIGYETFGDAGRRITSVIIGLYGFGFTVALYLLAADNARLFFQFIGVDFRLCAWVPIIICLSAPLMWFGTPKDMVAVGIVLGSTTLLGAMGLVIGTLLDIGVYADETTDVQPTFVSVTGGLGLIMSAFGGQFVVPTLQHDMKNPEDMQVSVALGYTGIASIYLLIGVPAFLVYGDIYHVFGVDNIIALLTTEALQIIVIFLLSTHLISGCVFLSNPLFQDVENALGIPYDITWKRILLRSSYSLSILLVAVTVPSFPDFLSVVGGALSVTVNGILPTVLYIKLCSLDPPHGVEPEQPLRWYHTLGLCGVIVMAFVAGILSSTSGVYNMLRHIDNTTLPCYVQFATLYHRASIGDFFQKYLYTMASVMSTSGLMAARHPKTMNT